MTTSDIPLGLCGCGCGERTALAKQTAVRRGQRKGQPMRYLPSHNGRRLSPEQGTYYERNRERLIAKANAWQQANPERAKAKMKAWREANPERYKSNIKAWREANPGRHKAIMKAWREANHERHERNIDTWRKANPERHRENLNKAVHRRRARLQNLPSEAYARREIWERDGGICGICGAPADSTNWSADHIIPIVKGGPDIVANIQVSHPICNYKKGARLSVTLSPAPPA